MKVNPKFLGQDDRFPVEKGGKHGYIDSMGRLAVDARFDKAGAFSDGLACVAVGDKYGYIDASGSLVIDARYDFQQTGYFSEGFAAFKAGRLWALRGGNRRGLGLRRPLRQMGNREEVR